jgi:hypothetical protein
MSGLIEGFMNKKRAYSSPSSANEKYSSLVTIIWSITFISSNAAPAFIFLVSASSYMLGFRDPEGWL